MHRALAAVPLVWFTVADELKLGQRSRLRRELRLLTMRLRSVCSEWNLLFYSTATLVPQCVCVCVCVCVCPKHTSDHHSPQHEGAGHSPLI
ncbi:hypothetical protein EXN66_Car012114 [Channa argus]|uniref:Uncharacterized protein n=1 Tax=Channa argus TaxID=215402 RepID=A0A6G1Q2L2_CHAAH|nr:hypothetical protein EXN66_Car012114 [Channa argus]